MRDAELRSSTSVHTQCWPLRRLVYHTDVTSKTMGVEHAGNIKSKISKWSNGLCEVRASEFRVS
jgi:hypothetical protein